MPGLCSRSGRDKTGFTGYILSTNNIEETCETLKDRGGAHSKEPSTEPWGKWAQFTDPFGNAFGIRLHIFHIRSETKDGECAGIIHARSHSCRASQENA
jgi:Glyoxalase/Bleomycin resistance protein/Dioxygenase superfamily